MNKSIYNSKVYYQHRMLSKAMNLLVFAQSWVIRFEQTSHLKWL